MWRLLLACGLDESASLNRKLDGSIAISPIDSIKGRGYSMLFLQCLCVLTPDSTCIFFELKSVSRRFLSHFLSHDY